MTWSYSGDPADSDLDETRFIGGFTDEDFQLVQDEEVNWAITQTTTTMLAAALLLRSVAAYAVRKACTHSIGDISCSCSELAQSYLDKAKDLDPFDQTLSTLLARPSFGGLSKAEKEALAADPDAVQPSFSRGMNDIPSGPSDAVKTYGTGGDWNYD